MGAMVSQTPPSPLFTHPFIQAQIKENIKAPPHWPLCGQFTGDKRPVTRKMSPFDDVIMQSKKIIMKVPLKMSSAKFRRFHSQGNVSSNEDAASLHALQWPAPIQYQHQCWFDIKKQSQKLSGTSFHQINMIHFINNLPFCEQGQLGKHMSLCRHCLNLFKPYTLLCEKEHLFNSLCLAGISTETAIALVNNVGQ